MQLKIIIAFAILLLVASCTDKTDYESEFLNQIIGANTSTNVLHYNNDTLYFVKRSNRIVIYDTLKRIRDGSFILCLSEKERYLIQNNLKCMSSDYWSMKLKDGLTIKNELGKRLGITKSCENGTCFTKPLFLRNNTLCVFGEAYFPVNGGFAYFKIYERKDGEWRTIYSFFNLSID